MRDAVRFLSAAEIPRSINHHQDGNRLVCFRYDDFFLALLEYVRCCWK